MRLVTRRRVWSALVAFALSVTSFPVAVGVPATAPTTSTAPEVRADVRSPNVNAERSADSSTSLKRASGLSWSSGVTPIDVQGTQAERFGRKRGAKVDNVVVYPARDSWETMLSTFWYGALPSYFSPARDDLVVSLPLWPASSSVTSTGTDQQWISLGNAIASADADAYVRLAWEMNLEGMYWAITRANRDAWIAAYRRVVRLIQIGCPNCQIVWNPNHGVGTTNTDVRGAFKRLQDLVDVYGIDDYDIYPAIKNDATRNEHLNEFGRLNESLRFAIRNRVKFAVPEWGIACNGPGCQWQGNAGGDNPLFIRTYVNWFREHARSLAFESYFDEPSRNVRSSLYTRPMGRLAGLEYRAELKSARARPSAVAR